MFARSTRKMLAHYKTRFAMTGIRYAASTIRLLGRLTCGELGMFARWHTPYAWLSLLQTERWVSA
jgi:hypothetical protein